MDISLSKIVEGIPEAMSIKFNMIASDLRHQGKDIILLSLGEAFFDIPLFPFDTLAVNTGYHYSDPRGLPELRERLSSYYLKEYGVNSNHKNEILVSAGSKILIYMGLASILNPGDEAVVFEPAWVSYVEQIKLSHGLPVTVPYYEGIVELDKYLNRKTKVIILNNPNNPSGRVYSREELALVFDFAKRHNLFIVSDEAYSDFVSKELFVSMGSFDEEKRRVIIVNSLSKNFGMSGWRIGYAIANERTINSILKLNQHLITCPPTLLELYFVKYFDRILATTKPQIKKVLEQREEMAGFMTKIGLKYLPGSGTFYFCVSINGSGLDSQAFALRLLKEHQVATVPGIGYGRSLDKFLRVSVGAESSARIRNGLLAIRELINKTKA